VENAVQNWFPLAALLGKKELPIYAVQSTKYQIKIVSAQGLKLIN